MCEIRLAGYRAERSKLGRHEARQVKRTRMWIWHALQYRRFWSRRDGACLAELAKAFVDRFISHWG